MRTYLFLTVNQAITKPQLLSACGQWGLLGPGYDIALNHLIQGIASGQLPATEAARDTALTDVVYGLRSGYDALYDLLGS